MTNEGGIGFSKRSHHGQTCQTADPWMVIPHQKRKEMDKLKSEQWPDVTLFKNWKTSFPREVITGSSRPRQATDWLAEIDQATPVHDLDDVGSVFGSTRMSFENQYSQFAKGPHEDHES